jgi:hypothetical protein
VLTRSGIRGLACKSVCQTTRSNGFATWRQRMTRFKPLLVPLIAVAVLATPAAARARHVTPRHLTDDANAIFSTTPLYMNGPVAIRVPHVRSFAPPPSDGGTCDVGDNPRVC